LRFFLPPAGVRVPELLCAVLLREAELRLAVLRSDPVL
jgi:hypothetical protein